MSQRLILGIRTDAVDSSVILAQHSTSSSGLTRGSDLDSPIKPAGRPGRSENDKGIEIDRIDWPAGRQLSATLLAKIEELLGRNHKTWDDLSGIVTYEGPGSFTGLRIGITVANTAAFILNIPIVGATSDNWLEQGIKQLTSDHFVDIVMPEYGAEANITKPKK